MVSLSFKILQVLLAQDLVEDYQYLLVELILLALAVAQAVLLLVQVHHMLEVLHIKVVLAAVLGPLFIV